MWATFRRNREETGQAIRKWRGGKKEPPRKRRFICSEETREPSRKPRQKKTFRFSFHPTTSWNTPLLHSLWAVRSHFLSNVDVVGQSFPNIWLACLLPFRLLNQDYRQWNEKLIKANFFLIKKKPHYYDPATWPMAGNSANWALVSIIRQDQPAIMSQPPEASERLTAEDVRCRGNSVLRGRCTLEADIFHYLCISSRFSVSYLNPICKRQMSKISPLPTPGPKPLLLPAVHFHSISRTRP